MLNEFEISRGELPKSALTFKLCIGGAITFYFSIVENFLLDAERLQRVALSNSLSWDSRLGLEQYYSIIQFLHAFRTTLEATHLPCCRFSESLPLGTSRSGWVWCWCTDYFLLHITIPHSDILDLYPDWLLKLSFRPCCEVLVIYNFRSLCLLICGKPR